MSAAIPSPTLEKFTSFDAELIAYRTIGEGRPVLLIHGLFSNSTVNWIKFGTAQKIAEAGFRVILPDLRVHGDSAAPRHPKAYPADVLALDQESLITHLGLIDFDLGGFSLGARITMRLLARGARPRRAIVAGMGLTGITSHEPNTEWFLNAIARRDEVQPGDEEWLSVQFMRSNCIDPEAAALLLRSQMDTPEERIARIETPTLVLCGKQDSENASAQTLANRMPHAIYREIPGTHMNSVTKPDFAQAIVQFLAATLPQ